jgi:glutathione synthase/RimK-type ligase-like ATP-grasp enzyme
MKIALVCYHVLEKYQHSTVKDEDGPLLQFLRDNGLDIYREVWNDESVNWSGYDLVVLKAPWDYHDQLPKFLSWLESVENGGSKVLNPPEIIRWNSDKEYLLEIAQELPVIKSLVLKPGDSFDLKYLQNYFESNKLVVKPTISAGAKHTYLVSDENISEIQSTLQTLIDSQPMLVQEFAGEVQSEGEWSFLFFNGEYSHHLLKKPGKSDFRVQHYFGGTIHKPETHPDLVDQTAKYVGQFAKGCMYARVDGIIRNGTFYLMELELIEPLLFLAYAKDGETAAQRRYLAALNQQIERLNNPE